MPEFKHRLVVAACETGVSVSKLAQDHGINTNMMFKWRRDLRAGLLTGPATDEMRLLPVVLKPSSPSTKPASGAARGSAIEITIAEAICRRNYLFAGADSGGERAAATCSLIGTAKLNGIDPEAW